jgi:hypothetical protein
MYAQLVCAPRNRDQPKAATVFMPLNNSPESLSRFTMLVIDNLQWTPLRITAQWYIHLAGFFLRLVVHFCDIGLFGFTILKLAA